MNVADNVMNFSFAGYDTVALAKKYGTPLYVLSEEAIRSKCREVKNSFLEKYTNTKAAYASKAFLTMTMCKIIDSEGMGLDVVSGGELYTAIQANFPMSKVMFHGNNKSYDEIKMAIEHEVGRIVVDHLGELDIIDEISQSLNKDVKVLIRITPGVEGNTHKFIFTGQKDSKFGIPFDKENIYEAVSKCMNSKHIELMGFHFHVGSNLFENEVYVKAIETVIKLYKTLKDDLGFIGKELNTGGGFGIYYTKNDDVKPLSYFVDCIMSTIDENCKELEIERPTIIIEPGRWIVGEAGITLYSIGAIKNIPNIRTYVSVDGGLPDNPRPALYDAKYEAVVANKYNMELTDTVTIAGKCCETGDILIWDLQVPQLERGDILAVLSTGAYNYSMASNYNKLPRPAVVLLGKEEDKLIIERESYSDLLKYERVPF